MKKNIAAKIDGNNDKKCYYLTFLALSQGVNEMNKYENSTNPTANDEQRLLLQVGMALSISTNEEWLHLSEIFKKYDPNQQNEKGDTLLHQAIYRGHFGVTKFLRLNGASLAIRNNKGCFPFAYLIRDKKIKLDQRIPRVIQLLNESGITCE